MILDLQKHLATQPDSHFFRTPQQGNASYDGYARLGHDWREYPLGGAFSVDSSDALHIHTCGTILLGYFNNNVYVNPIDYTIKYPDIPPLGDDWISEHLLTADYTSPAT